MEYQVFVLILAISSSSSQGIKQNTMFWDCPEKSPMASAKRWWFWHQSEPVPVPSNPGLPNNECVGNIYNRCNNPTRFTDEELENVRLFLNYTFTQLADIKPDKPLCPKIHVRQDWKCLTGVQKNTVIDVWREMYNQGIIKNLTAIYAENWSGWHKTVERLTSYQWLYNEFERYMRVIDPTVSLPYWQPWLYGAQPERSSIWETLGHAGNYSNFYRVPDGVYPSFNITPAVRRHWGCGKISPWATSEISTSIIQTAKNIGDFAAKRIALHWQPHLSVGGYDGQLSTKYAPYDLLFYLLHSADTEINLSAWQFLRRENLTPLSYNLIKTHFNRTTGYLEQGNIQTDNLTGVPGVTIRELFWKGFGDHCAVPDRFVKPMSKLWKAIQTNTVPESEPMPTAAKRFPKWIIEKYFPVFMGENYSVFSHLFEEVGECNNRCIPLPKINFMRDTEQGRRLFMALQYDNGVDLGGAIDSAEQYLHQLWLDLNRSGYCSPQVTTYSEA